MPLLLLLLLLFVVSGRASLVTHPNINFDSLQQIAISGSYNGISLYKDTQQLTQIPTSTSSIISLSNDTLKLIASSNINGVIYDACILADTLYISGNFSTINGLSVNNIASFDLTTGRLSALNQGLDGPVYSIYCDTDSHQLVAGGSFIAPVDVSMIRYSDSLSQFGGSVALWKNETWVGLPWKGLNGPVYSIAKQSSTSLLFGGKFDASTDGQVYHAPASQPISLSSAGVTATNTASGSASPGSIICADASNPNPWYLSDGVAGTWQATFLDYSVNPVLVRIANSKLENHQTSKFSIRSLTDSAVYNLTYLDPDTNTTKTCSANCTLSNNPNVGYQDFRITNLSLASGIAIDIHDWYGTSGGLGSVKVFQSEIFTYAVNPESSNICASTSSSNSSNPLPKITYSGNWTSSDTSIPYLTLKVTDNDLTSPPSVTFYPNLLESGLYEVLLYSPTCADTNCTERANVDVILQTAPGQSSNVSVVKSETSGQSVFTGYFSVSSNFTPSVTVALSKNNNITSTSSNTAVAHSVQFIKNPSVDVLYSMIGYNMEQTTVTASSIPWGKLPNNIPGNSVVKSMDVLDNTIYIGGNFSGTDTSNNKYSNIVKYDTKTSTMSALQDAGPNGLVEAVACTDNGVFVGGKFTGTSTVNNLSNVARYDVQKGSWNALSGGVDGPVLSISWLEDTQSALVSGQFTQLLKTASETYSNTTAGTASWDTKHNQWSTADLPYLSGVVYRSFNHKNNMFYVGSIDSAQRYQSSGISFISSENGTKLSSLDSFYPGGSNNASITAGVIYNAGSTTTTPSTGLAKRDISNSSSVSIFGGQFSLPGDIQNVAIYNNSNWSGLQGSNWQGVIHSMAVNNNLLYVGGRFTGTDSNNLAVFDLNSKSISMAPAITTSDGSPASVNVIRHIYTQNAMVVGGNFSNVGSISCPSVCSVDINSLQWSTLGSGLVGDVSDLQLINEKLVAAGNLSLSNNPLLIAEYDFSKKTWGPFGTADLPGPSQYMSYDNVTQHVYIAGQASNASSYYLRIWDGQQFNTPSSELGAGSVISSLSMLPVKTTNSSGQNVLLASGLLNLNSLGNVSAAFFDGKSWTPYLTTSSVNGNGIGGLNGVFFMDQQPIIAPKKTKEHMATPLVILVAIAISLGIVFLIVLLSMIIMFVKRKRDTRINPQSNPVTYYGKPPRTPESLLTTLKASSPDDDDKYQKDTGEKPRYLQPENQQLYNMSRSISTEHLQEQNLTPFNPIVGGVAAMTTARAAPIPPTAHSRSASQQQNYNNLFGNTTAIQNNVNGPSSMSGHVSSSTTATAPNTTSFANVAPGVGAGAGTGATGGISSAAGMGATGGMGTGAAAATAAAGMGAGIVAASKFHNNTPTVFHDAARPESYARPYSEIQRDSNTSSFYQNDYTNTREMSEVPSRYSPFNPFRNSEVSTLDAGAGSGLAAAAMIASKNNRPQERGMAPAAQTPQAIAYSNLAPPEPSSMAVTPTPETVRWTTAPSAAPSSAIVKPISLVGTSDGSSSLIDPISGPGTPAARASAAADAAAAEKVRWTNAPSSKDALATAVIAAPLLASNHSSMVSDGSNADPSTLSSRPPTSLKNVAATSTPAPGMSNVRWTNCDTNNALGIATIEPVGRDSSGNPYLSSGVPSTLTSIPDDINSADGFSSDPDIVRWTTAPSASKNMAKAKVEPVLPIDTHESTIGRNPQYKASLSSLAYPYDIEHSPEEMTPTLESAGLGSLVASAFTKAPSSSNNNNSSINNKDNTDSNSSTLSKNNSTASTSSRVINSNAFRLSDTGSLPAVDANGYSAFNRNVIHQEPMSPDSAVRWKTANVGSPIETVYAPHILEPATATVTRRYTDEIDRNGDQALEDYYNQKPQQAVPVSKKNTDKFKPVANENHVATKSIADSGSNVPQIVEPVGRKSEAIEDVIANRDLNTLSFLIDEENQESMPTHPNQQADASAMLMPTPTRSTPSPSGVNAVDGRAASKRMVEEYLTSKKSPTPTNDDSKRHRYKSDFKSLMETAILNNASSPVATDDQPHLYYAKFDFNAREEGELGFEKSDPIIVVDSSDDIWWVGYKADKSDGSFIQGVFPSNYVEIALSIRK